MIKRRKKRRKNRCKNTKERSKLPQIGIIVRVPEERRQKKKFGKFPEGNENKYGNLNNFFSGFKVKQEELGQRGERE